MLFEIYIHPKFKNKEVILVNLQSFFKFKNYLSKHRIIIYTSFKSTDFDLKKYHKLNIKFVHINDTIANLRQLWIKNLDNYNNEEWIIHYNIEDRMLEFDFIKMIFKKVQNTFVKRNSYDIYKNLFCIHIDLLLKFISSDYYHLDPKFIIYNSHNYCFLKYMNIISKNEMGENIYI